MIAIIISNPKYIDNESNIINSLFDNGLMFFHIRKDIDDINSLESLIKSLKPEYYNRIILHHNFELVEKYNLKGYHFGKKTKHLLKDFINNSFQKSISCHYFDEIEKLQYSFDYVFLSPIFDSISKTDYKSTFNKDELTQFIENYKSQKIIALGGIAEDNIDIIKQFGFYGFAILGDLWGKNINNSVYYIKNILSKCS